MRSILCEKKYNGFTTYSNTILQLKKVYSHELTLKLRTHFRDTIVRKNILALSQYIRKLEIIYSNEV